jgi:hypothetical protein
LLPDEVAVSTFVGTHRFESSRRKGWKNKAGGCPTVGDDVQAAGAEMAVAKHLNLYWHVAYELNRTVGDVGGYEVRWVRKDGGRLLVRPGDDMSKPYVLVEGCDGVFEIVGWFRGTELKGSWVTDFGNGRPHVYAVPRSALRKLG